VNFTDLKKLIHLADSQNLQQSAAAFNITSGALSKTLKKIELKLNTALFDRIGRNIQLNQHGQQFIYYARSLVHEYEQMCSEFKNAQSLQVVNITGPSVLLNHCIDKLMTLLTKNNMEINIDVAYEGQALKQLKNSQTHIAVVTDEVLHNSISPDIATVPLGKTTFKIVAAKSHPLFRELSQQPKQCLSVKDILKYAFVCPKNSPFCGISRGIGSDGWPDQAFPRNIAFRCDDFSALLSLVKQGHAIAYVPDFTIEDNDLAVVTMDDFNYSYQEAYSLVYKPSAAYGWLNHLVSQL